MVVMWKLMNPIDYRKAMEPSGSFYIIAWRRNDEEKNNRSLCKLLHLTFLSSFDFVAFSSFKQRTDKEEHFQSTYEASINFDTGK